MTGCAKLQKWRDYIISYARVILFRSKENKPFVAGLCAAEAANICETVCVSLNIEKLFHGKEWFPRRRFGSETAAPATWCPIQCHGE